MPASGFLEIQTGIWISRPPVPGLDIRTIIWISTPPVHGLIQNLDSQTMVWKSRQQTTWTSRPPGRGLEIQTRIWIPRPWSGNPDARLPGPPDHQEKVCKFRQVSGYPDNGLFAQVSGYPSKDAKGRIFPKIILMFLF